jgi:hypothetical protein
MGWIRENNSDSGRARIYADHRTLFLLNPLMGYRGPEYGFRTYPAYWRESAGKPLEPAPPLYVPIQRGMGSLTSAAAETGGARDYWVVNPYYLTFLLPKHRYPWVRQAALSIPASWELEAVFARSTNPSSHVGLFRIRDAHAGVAPARPQWAAFTLARDETDSPPMAWTMERGSAEPATNDGQGGIRIVTTREGTVKIRSPKLPWTSDSGIHGDFGLFVDYAPDSSPPSPLMLRVRVHGKVPAVGSVLAGEAKVKASESGTAMVLVKQPQGAQDFQVSIDINSGSPVRLLPLRVYTQGTQRD